MELNSRVVLPGAILLLVSLLWLNNWLVLAAAILLIFPALRLANCGAGALATQLWGFRWLVVLNLLFLWLIPLGMSLLPGIQGVHPDFWKTGIHALFISARLVLILLFSLLFVRLAGPEKMLDVLGILAEPFAKLGLPARRWVFTISLAWRLLPVIQDDSRWIRYSQTLTQSRKTGFWERMRRESRIALPLLQTAFDRAEDVQTALICRACSPEIRPMSLQEGTVGAREIFFVTVVSGWLVALFILRSKGNAL